MTREEEDMMLSLIESSANEDMSQSERFASIAKMKHSFVQMYRAKSRECEQKTCRIDELEKLVAEQDKRTLPPQQVTNNYFNGEIKQMVGHVDQQTIQTKNTDERTND